MTTDDISARVADRFRTGGQLPPELLRTRLRQIGRRLRRLVTQARVRPDVPAHELVDELKEVIKLVEGLE